MLYTYKSKIWNLWNLPYQLVTMSWMMKSASWLNFTTPTCYKLSKFSVKIYWKYAVRREDLQYKISNRVRFSQCAIQGKLSNHQLDLLMLYLALRKIETALMVHGVNRSQTMHGKRIEWSLLTQRRMEHDAFGSVLNYATSNENRNALALDSAEKSTSRVFF